jgi:hypothetical protein
VIRSFELPANIREIPVSTTPIVVKHYSGPASHELEAGLRNIFENNGLSIPIPVGDLSGASDST